jgi:membrane protein implicated in regulation of membrane protease activity
MRRFDRYIGPLIFFSIGYVLCLTTADTIRAGDLHITMNGVGHLWSASATPTAFWRYVGAVGFIGLALVALAIYTAVFAYRTTDPSRLQISGSIVLVRLVGFWLLVTLIYTTYSFLRKWI